MVLGADDALGLLAGGGGGGDDEPPAKKAKNDRVRHWELPPAQLLHPMGQSSVGKVQVRSLWSLLRQGDDKALYHGNLCSDQPARRGVGLSQRSQVLLSLLDAKRPPA